MKYRKLLLILPIAILSLTACKKEESPTTTETIVTEVITAEKEPTATEELSAVEETAQNNTDVVEDVVMTSDGNNGEGTTEEFTETDSGLSPSNITVNEDGSYSFTDDFMIAVQGINGAAGLSDKRLDEALQMAASVIVNEHLTDEQDIVATIETEISIQEYNQATEKADTQKPDSQNVSNQNVSNQNSTQADQPNYSDEQSQTGNVAQVGPLDHLFEYEDSSGGTHAEGDGTHVGTSH